MEAAQPDAEALHENVGADARHRQLGSLLLDQPGVAVRRHGPLGRCVQHGQQPAGTRALASPCGYAAAGWVAVEGAVAEGGGGGAVGVEA
jgi:hypothetical protein